MNGVLAKETQYQQHVTKGPYCDYKLLTYWKIIPQCGVEGIEDRKESFWCRNRFELKVDVGC
jgi:hypothetical protein